MTRHTQEFPPLFGDDLWLTRRAYWSNDAELDAMVACRERLLPCRTVDEVEASLTYEGIVTSRRRQYMVAWWNALQKDRRP